MSLHAVAAHFPLGALAASLLFDLLHAWTRREEFAHVGRWTLLLGTVFGAIALATGWVAARAPGEPAETPDSPPILRDTVPGGGG